MTKCDEGEINFFLKIAWHHLWMTPHLNISNKNNILTCSLNVITAVGSSTDAVSIHLLMSKEMTVVNDVTLIKMTTILPHHLLSWPLASASFLPNVDNFWYEYSWHNLPSNNHAILSISKLIFQKFLADCWKIATSCSVCFFNLRCHLSPGLLFSVCSTST